MTADATARHCAPLGRGLLDELGTELVRHARIIAVVKAATADAVPAGIDHGAMTVLAHLVKGGPLRQGELSDVALLDPSTVSRRVGQLVARGLVERQADPDDGRAVRLAATPAGLEYVEALRTRRRAVMDRVLADWDPADVETFVRLLRRLNDGTAAVCRDAGTAP